MAENPLPGNPQGLAADPRYRKMLLGFDFLRPGQQNGYHEVVLTVMEGEGEVFYEPNYLPTLGTIQDGTLVIASPCFPRYAPLTLRVEGADLCFFARFNQVIACCLINGQDDLMRISCSNFMRAAHRLKIRRREAVLDEENDVTMQHLDLINENVVTQESNRLESQVLRGKVTGLNCARVSPIDGTSENDRIFLRRNRNGEIRWRLQSARMEWDFRDGKLTELRLYSGCGPIAKIGLVDLEAAGVSIDVAFLDDVD